MHIPIEKFEIFNKWQFKQVTARIRRALELAGQSMNPAFENQIVTTTTNNGVSTTKEYLFKTNALSTKSLFKTIMLLNEQQNLVLIFEWPGGEQEYEIFNLL